MYIFFSGSVIIDDYSCIEALEDDVNVTLSMLVKVLNPLSSKSHYNDLVVVSGNLLLFYNGEETI